MAMFLNNGKCKSNLLFKVQVVCLCRLCGQRGKRRKINPAQTLSNYLLATDQKVQRQTHHKKSEFTHSQTLDVKADVKLLPLMHHDEIFLFRKLLCWPMMQRSP